MYRVGTDILEVSRMEKALARNSRFMERVFTEYEKNYIENKVRARTAGGIFCAKEAVSKLLGTGIRGFKWKDIEVKHEKHGKPTVELHNNAMEVAKSQGIERIELSISHSDLSIMAVAIGEAVKKSTYQKKYEFSLSKRNCDTHKGDYGKIAIIGGSTGMAGAPYISARAALRSGSGLVYSFVPNEISDIMQIKSLENIVVSLGDEGRGFFTEDSTVGLDEKLQKMDVLAIGPGMGRHPDTEKFMRFCLKEIKKTMVIDADGIFHLKCLKKELECLNQSVVITPHEAEFANFLGIDVKKLGQNRAEYALGAAEKYGITVVLKGNKTIVTDGKEIYTNRTGNPGMATAGSGDALTGIIASFIGQGVDPFEASKLGVYVHGLSGDRAAGEKGEYGMLASDIIESIPYVLMEIVRV